MKLAVAAPLYPPELGGPATYAALLEAELPAQGIDIELIKFSAVRAYLPVVRHLVYFFQMLSAGKRADAILALDPVSTGLPAALAARLLRKPFFVKIVGDYAWEQGTQRFGVLDSLDEFVKHKPNSLFVGMLQRIQRFVALSAKKIIVPSAYLKSIVVAWEIPASRIEVVHNAVPRSEIGKVPDLVEALPHPLIVSVGRLVPWKGMTGVIEAVEKVRETIPVSLVIVGSGPEEEMLRTKIKAKLGDAGLLTGALSHEETLAVIAHADIFVLNSSYEGLSHLLIEALSLGKPIVTTSVGGNPELITHGENGLLVRSGDCKALAEAIRALLIDEPLRTRMAESARTSSERFSVSALIESTSALLKKNV
jgi:glycosyltransferase involved in cell wall biosynthesis